MALKAIGKGFGNFAKFLYLPIKIFFISTTALSQLSAWVWICLCFICALGCLIANIILVQDDWDNLYVPEKYPCLRCFMDYKVFSILYFVTFVGIMVCTAPFWMTWGADPDSYAKPGVRYAFNMFCLCCVMLSLGTWIFMFWSTFPEIEKAESEGKGVKSEQAIMWLGATSLLAICCCAGLFYYPFAAGQLGCQVERHIFPGGTLKDLPSCDNDERAKWYGKKEKED